MEKTRFGLADGLVQRKKQAMGGVGIRYSALLILGLELDLLHLLQLAQSCIRVMGIMNPAFPKCC